MTIDSPSRPRLVFLANTLYGNHLTGGDNHTLQMAIAAMEAGYPVHFFAGHAMQTALEQRQIPTSVTLTDKQMMRPRDFATLPGQLRLLVDYFVRLSGTLRRLSEIRADNIAYANSEFWWDSVPTILCKARRKVLFLAMDCPTFGEILRCSRPDVQAVRLPSVHYWLSQMSTLRSFRYCRRKRILYVHPNQKARLAKMGYRESELFHISSGVDLTKCLEAPAQAKIYDVVWMGRVHHQKGVDDLLETLAFLAAHLNDFRAVIIGNVKTSLEPRIRARGLADQVQFSGFVPETEKFRLMKSSRLFLMPSRYESWGTVIAEALASELPVLAYDLEAYRPVFGDLVYYVKPFEAEAFKETALDLVQKSRGGQLCINHDELARFKEENTWTAAGERFLKSVRSLCGDVGSGGQ